MLNFTLFTRDLLDQVIPYVIAPTASTPTPITARSAGCRWAALQSVEIGFAHPELFRYVLAYSGGFGALGPQPPATATETQSPWKEAARGSGGQRKRISRLLFLGSGQQESGMLGPGRRLGAAVQRARRRTRAGRIYPGGHVFSVWRKLLHESAPLLFKKRRVSGAGRGAEGGSG